MTTPSVRRPRRRAAALLIIVPAAMGALAGTSGIAAIWLALAVFLGGGAVVALRTPFDALTEVEDPRSSGDGGLPDPD